MKITAIKTFVGLILSLAMSVSCTKNSGELFSNCKLPIADGRGGAAIGGFPRYSSRMNSTGTVNVNFIMVDFVNVDDGEPAITVSPTNQIKIDFEWVESPITSK